jgi:hypothetical protein
LNDSIPDFYNNKDLVYDEIWKMLANGVVDRDEDFRLPIVIANQGQFSDGRIVVLRGAFKDKKVLRFHSDIRSSKMEAFKKNNNIYFLFYSKQKKIQVRAKGKATIHFQNDVSKECWKKTHSISRKCYLAEQAPGTTSASPNPGYPRDFENRNPKLDESEIGYKNFSVVDSEISEFDWLYLASKGHRRLKIFLNDMPIKSEWVTP